MSAALPLVRVTGPGRNIGKTWLSSRLIEALAARGYRVGAVKRSHHLVMPDREGSDTDLFARAGASPVLFAAGDGILTRGEVATSLSAAVVALPPTLDVVVVEGFKSDTLGARIDIEPAGEASRLRLSTMDGVLVYEGAMTDIDTLTDALECALGLAALGSEELRAGVRRAAVSHGHRCPGLTLGVRMALYATSLLGLGGEHGLRDLVVEAETARCATDAVAAVTGCSIGSGRLRVSEYGKLAATFSRGNRAVRVSARAGLRELASSEAGCTHPAHQQDRAYRTLPDSDLFEVRIAAVLPAASRARGRHDLCLGCGEEVSGGLLETTAVGPRCIPCAKSLAYAGERCVEPATLLV